MTDVEMIGQEFARLLAAELGPVRTAEVVRRNAVEECEGVCHSHDFCDANMVMWDAFSAVMGRDAPKICA